MTSTRDVVCEITIHDDAVALADVAATDVGRHLAVAIDERGIANVMFAGGRSQVAFLAELAERVDVDWSRVVAFHLDEYLGIAADHPASQRRFVRKHLGDVVHPSALHLLAGDAPDPDAECSRYAALLAANPLDVCVVGVGPNGHLAFNDPPVADFTDPASVKVVALAEDNRRRQVDDGHFASLDEVPARAITVTIPAIMGARRVMALVPGAHKSEIVEAILRDPLAATCPATILRTVRHVHLYLDTDSASLL